MTKEYYFKGLFIIAMVCCCLCVFALGLIVYSEESGVIEESNFTNFTNDPVINRSSYTEYLDTTYIIHEAIYNYDTGLYNISYIENGEIEVLRMTNTLNYGTTGPDSYRISTVSKKVNVHVTNDTEKLVLTSITTNTSTSHYPTPQWMMIKGGINIDEIYVDGKSIIENIEITENYDLYLN